MNPRKTSTLIPTNSSPEILTHGAVRSKGEGPAPPAPSNPRRSVCCSPRKEIAGTAVAPPARRTAENKPQTHIPGFPTGHLQRAGAIPLSPGQTLGSFRELATGEWGLLFHKKGLGFSFDPVLSQPWALTLFFKKQSRRFRVVNAPLALVCIQNLGIKKFSIYTTTYIIFPSPNLLKTIVLICTVWQAFVTYGIYESSVESSHTYSSLIF